MQVQQALLVLLKTVTQNSHVVEDKHSFARIISELELDSKCFFIMHECLLGKSLRICKIPQHRVHFTL